MDGRNSEICIYGQIVVGLETVRSECVSDVYTRVTKHISSISKKRQHSIYILVQEKIANIPCLSSGAEARCQSSVNVIHASLCVAAADDG